MFPAEKSPFATKFGPGAVPPVGVNVYVEVPTVVVCIVVGNHSPVIPLGDVNSKAGGFFSPTHMVSGVGKSGVKIGSIVTVKVLSATHSPDTP